ncbi:T9SS type A sorting domain-containing protein [Chryseobacterium oranimense]|uniref:T9SS type A sorting domain-containing protein n=1 Tax=Chryseobacterium oranimense TaxID=421058 RepID=UPI0031D771F7
MNIKPLLIIIFCILFSIQTDAQPTITSADIITGTFSYTDVSFAQGTYNPGNGGANVTWDFSNIHGTTGGGTFFHGVCPSIPECSSFPTANRYTVPLNPDGTQTDDKNMFRITSTQFEALGLRNAATNTTVPYTDTPIELKFPTTYLQSFTDTSTLTASGGVVTTTNDVITVDGYGTIKTPVGTYTNVLRVKKASTVTSSIGGTSVGTTQLTTYTWYKNNREQIASFSIVNIVSPVTQPGPSAFQYTNSNVLATDESKMKKPVIMYPNPVRDGKLWINLGSDRKIKSVIIYDMTGKQIYKEINGLSVQIGGKYVINLLNCEEGNYIVKIETDKNTITETIQVQK